MLRDHRNPAELDRKFANLARYKLQLERQRVAQISMLAFFVCLKIQREITRCTGDLWFVQPHPAHHAV